MIDELVFYKKALEVKNALIDHLEAEVDRWEQEAGRQSAENSEFRVLLRMVLANLKNPILGGISSDQILAIDEALGYPYDSASEAQ